MKLKINATLLLQFILLFALALPDRPRAELVHLKDGQVLSGSITARDRDTITVKSAYLEKVVKRSDILRIEEAKKELEPLYILTTGGDTISGFLVEQDARQVVYRLTADSEEDRTISKLHVKKMSREEFRPVDLEFFLRPGVFLPLNPGNSRLGPAPMLMAGAGANSMWKRWMRLELEAGYAKSDSREYGGQYLRVLPVFLSATTDYVLPFYPDIAAVPRLGLGLAMLEYDDGEGGRHSGNAMGITAGLGLRYCLLRHRVYAGLWTDYSMLYDGSGMLHVMTLRISGNYRL